MNLKHTPFHLKYRPQNFKTIVGHSSITSYLELIIKTQKISFAYLLVGQHGSGKTTLARIMAKAINCKSNKFIPCNLCNSCLNIHLDKSLDFYEIDGAKNTGIDNIREIIENLYFAPILSKYKVCIIDEVHMLSNNAFSSLLKTLESPPMNTVFILLTTSITKVPNTIISRCQKFFLSSISQEDLSIAITKIANNERIKITNKGIKKILNISQGSFRDALNILEMFAFENTIVTMQSLNNKYLIPELRVIDYLIDKIFILNLLDTLTTISYIKNRTWNIKDIIEIMYSLLINRYINSKKFNNLTKYYFTKTQILNNLLKILANYNFINYDDFWKKIILFIVLNSQKSINLKKNPKNKKIFLYINKYKISSN